MKEKEFFFKNWAFRKVFGLICIGQYNGLALNSTFASSPNLSPNDHNNDQILRRSSVAKIVSSVDYICNNNNKNSDSEENLNVDPEAKQMNILKQEYQEIKQQFNDHLVDSRCVLFGFSSTQNSTEILSFPRSDDISLLFDQLELCTRDLLRSIYVVLDSKRLDNSFEKMDSPPYILLQEEEKYLMGIDNVKSKNHKKKCIGRLRKRLADYAFLTGYFELALNSYNSSIELLKSTQDLLWLAAATEGWCCAAMMIKYSQYLSPSHREEGFGNSIQLENRFILISLPLQNGPLDIMVRQHHTRYRRSDDAAKILITKNESDNNNSLLSSSSTTFVGNKTFPLEEDFEKEDFAVESIQNLPQQQQQQLLLPNNLLKNNKKQIVSSSPLSTVSLLPSPLTMSSAFKSNSVQNLPSITNNINGKSLNSSNNCKNLVINRNEIFEKFGQSLENYARYSFAVFIEYECMMRCVHLQVVTHQYVEVEAFLREQTCRFLDDKFTTFNNTMKSHICLATANIYRKIGFKRKFAFFLRLAVFFRLYMENQSEAEYKKVYPYLNESLSGYKIDWKLLSSSSNLNNKKSLMAQYLFKLGSSETFSLQIKAVHEVFTVAMRAGFFNIATRHLCFMLEAFFDHLDKATSLALVEELTKLNLQNLKYKNLHDLDKPITLDSCYVPSVVLPPLQFTKFPIIKNICILPLAEHLSPSIQPSSSNQSSIFIYSPFQQTFKEDVCWVVGCHSGISIHVENPLPIELIVDNLKLITEGCDFEPHYLRLNLPSCYGPCIDQSKNLVKLLGIPRSPGTLKIIGYACELLGCRNICKFSNERNESPQQQQHYLITIILFVYFQICLY
ncbi:hypothetical protein Mgra_00008327 [Meloidogyne graminicola]|uniref:Uncharacterized protein n=1 Tax=Meloidogyne graminicola TaxID=189291 RepID=A0A8S9ZG36_9BILA|nr:hypothetical protein Mgra_00008327 [Meloidogyne graminicola]